MTTLTNWLSPTLMHSLGWALLHFLWQGTALAALAAVLMSLCQRASTRYAVAVAALALMVAVPFVTFFVLIPSGGTASVMSSAAMVTVAQHSTASGNVAGTPSRFSPSLDVLPWLVEAWLFGVAFFSLRSAGGFLLLERERRKQSTTPAVRVLEICQKLQQQLG